MRYDDRNAKAISKLAPAMQHKVWQLLDRLELIGEDVLITDDFRSPEEQDALYAQGRTKAGKIVTRVKGGGSFHNYGVAIDFVPVGPLGVPLSKRWKLEWIARYRYARIAKEAQEIGFEWGFEMWREDRPHLQYRQGLSIGDFREGKTPDAWIAKHERLEDIQVRIAKAKKALERRITNGRKKRLTTFVRMMERKANRIVRGNMEA